MKLVIIDRDGVVLRSTDGRAARPEHWQAVAGTPEAIARFSHAGVRVVLMTDRSALMRGQSDMSQVNALHARIVEEVVRHGGRVDAVLFVPSYDEVERTGQAVHAIESMLARMQVEPADTSLVSTRRQELDAAHAAGCRPILVLSGAGGDTLQTEPLPVDTIVRVDLAAVAAELAV